MKRISVAVLWAALAVCQTTGDPPITIGDGSSSLQPTQSLGELLLLNEAPLSQLLLLDGLAIISIVG